MSLTGVDVKCNLPEWLVKVIAQESDRLLLKPEAIIVQWLDAHARERGIIK